MWPDLVSISLWSNKIWVKRKQYRNQIECLFDRVMLGGNQPSSRSGAMNYLGKLCNQFQILQSEIDYHILRASMILIFLFFGYQKWFEYEAQALIPSIIKE